MKILFYSSILILCAISSEGTLAQSEENTKKLPDLNRKKRLINLSQDRNLSVALEDVPYIVKIMANGQFHCGGVILSTQVILTAAHCVCNEELIYHVVSGSSYRDLGDHHLITEKLIFPGYAFRFFSNDLALLKIYPPIDFHHSANRKIELYFENIRVHTPATFSGWGCIGISNFKKQFPNELQSFMVPIISLLDCNNALQPNIPITNKNICTYDIERKKGSCAGDSGGPLVVDDHLVGIMSWSIGYGEKPDVFVNLQRSEYRNWIALNLYRLDPSAFQGKLN